MLPLLEIGNEMDFRSEEARERDQRNRDFRRMTGKVQYFEDKEGRGRLIRGPYTRDARANWLRRVLEAQVAIREMGPPEVREWDLVTSEELAEIRRIWVSEKHETEDLLPVIYEEIVGEPYENGATTEHPVLGREALDLLSDICGDDALHYELTRNLLDIENVFRNRVRRRGLFTELQKAIGKCFFTDEDDALELAVRNDEIRQKAAEVKLRNMEANSGGEG